MIPTQSTFLGSILERSRPISAEFEQVWGELGQIGRTRCDFRQHRPIFARCRLVSSETTNSGAISTNSGATNLARNRLMSATSTNSGANPESRAKATTSGANSTKFKQTRPMRSVLPKSAQLWRSLTSFTEMPSGRNLRHRVQANIFNGETSSRRHPEG